MKTLGLIGVGKWGSNIIKTLEKIPEVDLKYICGREEISLASFPNKYEKLTDWKQLLSKNDLDAVIIATPAETHTSIALKFIEKNISVFVEKPMSLSVAEANKIKKAMENRKTIFMVGYQYIFNENFKYIKKLLGKKNVGEIVVMKYEHVKSPSRSDIDIFWDMASHPLSIYKYLFNPEKLISVKGELKADNISIEIKFNTLPTLKIIASNAGETKVRKITFSLKDSSIIVDETKGQNKLEIIKNGKITQPKIPQTESLANELTHFAESLHSGHAPISSLNFGVEITDWLETICRKLKSSK